MRPAGAGASGAVAGHGEYGADTEPTDLKDIFQAKTSAGVRTSACATARSPTPSPSCWPKAPVMERVKVLDLSLGTLTDKGAEALLANPRRREAGEARHPPPLRLPGGGRRLQATWASRSMPATRRPRGYGDEEYRYVAHAGVGRVRHRRQPRLPARRRLPGRPGARRSPPAPGPGPTSSPAEPRWLSRRRHRPLESPGATGRGKAADRRRGRRADEEGPSRIGRAGGARPAFDKGRIWYPRQWYLGFRSVSSPRSPCSRTTTPPADVEVLFDKARCQERFARAGVPVPRGLGSARAYDELRERMREAGCRDVFVKLLHGSSASGVVAYRRRRRGRHHRRDGPPGAN